MTMENVAFWTVGDTRSFLGSHGPQTSEIFEQVARHLAPSYAFGVRTINEAIIRLRTVSPPPRHPAYSRSMIRRFFFVGHGYNNGGGGYFFGGVADPALDWTASMNEVFSSPAPGSPSNPNARFIDEMKRISYEPGVYFLCCFVGGSTLPRAIADAFVADEQDINVRSTALYHGIDVRWTGSGAARIYTPTGYHRAQTATSPPIPGTQTGHLEVADMRQLEMRISIFTPHAPRGPGRSASGRDVRSVRM